MSASKDPIAAARGALKGRIGPSEKLREQARQDELAAERRSERLERPKRRHSA